MADNMTPEAKAARAEYYRQWRQQNKDKRREYQRRYWERKARDAKGDDTNEHQHRAEETAGDLQRGK